MLQTFKTSKLPWRQTSRLNHEGIDSTLHPVNLINRNILLDIFKEKTIFAEYNYKQLFINIKNLTAMEHNVKNPPVIIETDFKVEPRKVWEAITVPEKMKAWYFDVQNFELNVGNEFYFYEPDGTKYLHACKIIEIVPNRKLVYLWRFPELSKGTSVLTWNIQPQGDGTRLTLTHEGIDSFSDGGENFSITNFEEGWSEILKTSLKEFLS